MERESLNRNLRYAHIEQHIHTRGGDGEGSRTQIRYTLKKNTYTHVLKMERGAGLRSGKNSAQLPGAEVGTPQLGHQSAASPRKAGVHINVAMSSGAFHLQKPQPERERDRVREREKEEVKGERAWRISKVGKTGSFSPIRLTRKQVAG